jgi:hypothetical protein
LFVIEPPDADQVTAVDEKPVAVAVNCCVPPNCRETEVGEIATEAGLVLLLPLGLAAAVTPPQPQLTMRAGRSAHNNRTLVVPGDRIAEPRYVAARNIRRDAMFQ